MADGFTHELGQNGSASTGTSLAVTSAFAVPVGDDVWVLGEFNVAPGTVSVSDGLNTYAIDISETSATPFTYLLHAKVTTAITTSTVITLSNTTTGGGRTMSVIAATGIGGSVNQTGQLNSAASTMTLTVTAGGANSRPAMFVIAGFGMAGATTANAATGYTGHTKGVSTGSVREAIIFEKTVAAVETSSCTQTWTTTQSSTGLIATYPLQGPLVSPVVVKQAVMQAAGW